MYRVCLVLLVGLIFHLIGSDRITEWNQKLTLAVETPAGEVTGTTVQSLRWLPLPLGERVANSALQSVFGAEGQSGSFDISAEAAMVELAPGRYLFALLHGGSGFDCASSESMTLAAIRYHTVTPPGRAADQIAKIGTVPLGKQRDLLPGPLPVLVTFADLSDPATVMQVDPDDLDAAFGCAKEPAGLVLPWRAAGQLYRTWLPEEVLRRANAEAAARAGITGPAAAALEETARILRPNWGPLREERERLAVLERAFTRDQKISWSNAHAALMAELPTTIATPAKAAAAWGGPCHRLNGVWFELTDQPATKGAVTAALPWLQGGAAAVAAGQALAPDGARNPLANALYPSAFSRDFAP